MTHEEVMTTLARSEVRSYKQLPQIWYQIQTKFRDEPRPKAGLLRVRQFLMKDSYSFDIDEAGLDLSYQKHDAVYRKIFTRCGLEFVAVEADSGAMGGSQSQEFMVYTDAGEDLIASSASGYAANLEKAQSKLAPVTDLEATGNGLPELVSTPGKASIADVTEFFGIEASQDIKTVAFMGELAAAKAGEPLRPVIAFLRGDHQVNETKLNSVAGTAELRPMNPEELELYFRGPAGYLGPVGLEEVMPGDALEQLKGAKETAKVRAAFRAAAGEGLKAIVVIDLGLAGRKNLVAGANKLDYHFRNVTPGRDFTPTVTADIRNINEGEPDPIAGEPLRLGKAVEIGHIFKLGKRYTDSMHATVLDHNGKAVTPIMGCYGIGVERILTAAIETSAAKHGGDAYVLPFAIAPFEVIVTITNVKEAPLVVAGEALAAELTQAGFDVLLDDRDERAGVKFKDADLSGVPFRIAIGKKLADGKVELLNRLTGVTDDISTEEVVQRLKTEMGKD
jgi:prolyl-tRNA synthetase